MATGHPEEGKLQGEIVVSHLAGHGGTRKARVRHARQRLQGPGRTTTAKAILFFVVFFWDLALSPTFLKHLTLPEPGLP